MGVAQFLDGTHLKGKYLRILKRLQLSMLTEVCPIAFGVVNAENNNNWLWFMTLIKATLADSHCHSSLTFLSDRQKGLVEDVGSVFSRITTWPLFRSHT